MIAEKSTIAIYKITSPSGKVYIGQTRNLTKRKSAYKTLKCKGQGMIYRSLKKYGFDNHRFEVIHQFDTNISQETLDYYEVFYINRFKNEGAKLLNLRNGGHKYKQNSSLTKKKISDTLKRKGIKPPSRIGTTLSEVHKTNLLNSRKGKKNSDKHNQILKEVGNRTTREHIELLARMKFKKWTIVKDGALLGTFLSAQEASNQTGISKRIIYSISQRQAIGCSSNKRTAGLKIMSQ